MDYAVGLEDDLHWSTEDDETRDNLPVVVVVVVSGWHWLLAQ